MGLSETLLPLLVLIWTVWSVPQREEDTMCQPASRLLRHLPLVQESKLGPDNRRLVGRLPNKTISIWDIVTGEMLAQLDFECTYLGYAWNSDGSQLVLMSVERALIVNSKDFSIVLNVSAFELEGAAAWSPDDSMIATVQVDGGQCKVWNASTGDLLAAWLCDNAMRSISWAPSQNIAVIANGQVETYNADGRKVWGKVVDSAYRARWGPGPAFLLAIGGFNQLVIITNDGKTVHSVRTAAQYVRWAEDGKTLATCNPRCTVWDIVSLEPLIQLDETLGHSIAGYSSADSHLVSRHFFGSGSYVWNARTPLVRVTPFPPSSELLGWVDRENLLFDLGNSSVQETNINTLVSSIYEISHADEQAVNVCISKGEVYSLTDNGTVVVFSGGRSVRHWMGEGDSRLYCSPSGQVATVVRNQIRIRDGLTGAQVALIDVPPTLPIARVGFITSEILAFSSPTSSLKEALYLWNPADQTYRYLEEVFRGCFAWSNNGAWIAAGADQFVIFNTSGDMRYRFNAHSRNKLSWSYDNNLVMAYAGGLTIFSPDYEVSWLTGLGDVEDTVAFWNPETLDIVLSSTETAEAWVPTPTLKYFSSNATVVGSMAQFTVTVVGANLLEPPLRMMVHWIDQSSVTAQCIFLDAWREGDKVISEPVELDAPGLYTVYIDPLSRSTPWLAVDTYLTMSCPSDAEPTKGADNKTTCICRKDLWANRPDSCAACPQHGICNGTSIVVSQPGYWPAFQGEERKFLPCAKTACVGRDLCNDLYEGPVCGLCKPGSAQHGFGQCSVCSSAANNILSLIGQMLGWTFLCGVGIYFALGVSGNENNKKDHSAQLGMVIVSTIQINLLLLSGNVAIPNLIAEETLAGGGIASPSLSCLLIQSGLNPGSVHWVKQILLLSLPMIAWLFLLLIRAILRCKGILWISDNVIRVSMVVVWSTIQSSISTSLLQTLSCTSVNAEGLGSGISYDLSVPCYDSRYWTMLGTITIPGILINMVIIPLYIFWLLHSHKTDVKSRHVRFLVKSYRTEWWFLGLFYRKFSLVVCATFSNNPFYGGCCLFVILVAQLLVSPSTAPVVNTAESVSLASCLFIFIVAGTLGDYDYEGGAYQYGPVLVFMVWIGSYILQIYLLYHDLKRSAWKRCSALRRCSRKRKRATVGSIILTDGQNTSDYIRLTNSVQGSRSSK